MKKLFSGQVYDILPVDDGGFIIVYRRAEAEGKIIVSYKSVSLENGVVTPRTRADYEFIKFGEHRQNIDFSDGNFINNSCVILEDGNRFIVSPEGQSRIIDAEGHVQWQGTIRYKECGPAAVAHHGHTLWASFPKNNALIRFNLRTMREELRIGGSNDSSFNEPMGLWVSDNEDRLIVCNHNGNNLLEVNMKTYTVNERASFDEPIYKYLCIGNKEFVVLESGLYLL